MEDPIRFDVWAKVIPEQRDAAIVTIRAQNIYNSEIELRKAINDAIRDSNLLQVARALSLSSALTFIEKSSQCFKEHTFCQESWAPSTDSEYCGKHNLHFGGCLGCHVCNGFYVR